MQPTRLAQTASNRKPTIVVKAGAARQSASSEDNPFSGEN